MKTLIILVLIILPFYGQDIKVYNPLEIGNQWQYTFQKDSWGNIGNTQIFEIQKDTIVNSKRYFKRKDFYPEFITNMFCWERYDTLQRKTFMLDVEDRNKDGRTDDELLLDDFSLDKWGVFWSYRFTWRYDSNTPKEGFESVIKRKELGYVFNELVEVFWIAYLNVFMEVAWAEKYGIVGWYMESPYYGLLACTINGIQYGKFEVGINEKNELPSKFNLRNYPNPFNPETTIEFDLPEEGEIKLTLFNILGEKVKEIENGYCKAGNYKIKIDGNNLSSGTYIIILQTNNKRITHKIQLIK